MKTNIFKRGTSAILALIMCLSAFIGIDTNKAFAVGEQSEAVLISFPRGGDSNYEGAWGHPSLKYMNGWSQESSTYYNIFAVGSFSGNICYCIEPGLTLDTGDNFVSKDESYWDNYPSDYNHTISAYEIKMFIGRIFQYGYTGKVDTNWHSQNAGDADKLSNAIATQLLVWETIVGERDGNFGKVSTGSCNAVLESVSSSHPLYSQIISHYNRISSSVQKHTKVPSFCSKTSSKANTIELEWNGKNYTAVLTDSNGVLSEYTFSANQSGITFNQNGNKLTITAAAAPSSVVNITASKANSQRKGIIVWDDGTYKPGVGKQNLATYTQSVNDPVKGFVNIKVSYGSAKIVKTSDDGNVANLSFTITGNGINKTVKTNSKGEFQIDNLLPGTYTVTEQSYDKYEPQESRRVTVVSGKVATVNFKNKLKRGDVKVIKSSEDNFDEGITFHLYGTALSGLAVDEYALTDKNGIATFKDVPISGKTPYTLEEVNTAFRYVIPEKQTAPVKWKEVTSRNFNNILKKFTATVIKTDIENGTAQGEASLAGAKYGIFQGDQLVDEYFTDENGQFTTKEYICGDNWTLKEIEPSEGYLLDTTVHHIGAEAKLYKVEHNYISVDVNETVIKGNVAIIKHTDNGDTQIETPEKGAEFEVYLKSAGSYANADTNERDVIICDENGFGQTKDMPYGVYTVHQTKGWEGRELIKDFDVFISKNAQTYRYLINNAEFESYVKVVKLDAETGKTIPYAGAGFQIYDPDGNLVKMTFTYPNPTAIDTFYTDAEGSLVTPEMLPYGKGYSIVEVQAPYGYILDSTPIFFDVTEEHSTKESGVTLIKVNKENMAQKGTFTIEKTGEVFTGVSVIGGIDENGNVLPTIYQPIYEVQGLSDAVYEIIAAEDIITPDGTLRVSKGEVVDTVTTDETGFAKSKELYLGKYEIKEITAPYGMVLNKDSSIVELVYAGQNVSVTETAISLNNERQKVEISLEKTLEINELFGIGNNGEIQNINFGLFAAEDIISASGTEIPADGLIEIVILDENGKATVKTALPIGIYYIQELATDEHYILNETKYPIVFEYAGQETAKVVITANNGEPIENDMFYGSVSGIKSDENGDGLGSALIGLFQTDKGEFTEENAIMTTVSADDGSFSFEDIPYGTWYVREIEQPEGFVLNDTVYPVVISEDKQVIEIINEFIHGNIALTKIDSEYPDNKLTGAVFEVYKDSNGNGKLDDNDELLGTLTEKEIGEYEMNDLFYGRYFVKETKAPEGFVLDDGVYEVFIETDEMTYQVENKAGVGFINDAMRGALKIVKTSSDGKIKGFAFRITGSNGYDVTLETDENGEIIIENLRIGEYTVSEVNNEASAMYILPDDKQATVKTGPTTIVEMHNKLRDTPKTGDNSNIGLWFALAGLSMIGAAACSIAAFRKKKKGENK